MRRVIKIAFDDENGLGTVMEAIRQIPGIEQNEETLLSEYRGDALAAICRLYLDSLRKPAEKPLDQQRISEILGSTMKPVEGSPMNSYLKNKADEIKPKPEGGKA